MCVCDVYICSKVWLYKCSLQAISLGKEKQLIPVGSVMWSLFFDRQQWELLQKIVTVICATVYLCVS